MRIVYLLCKVLHFYPGENPGSRWWFPIPQCDCSRCGECKPEPQCSHIHSTKPHCTHLRDPGPRCAHRAGFSSRCGCVCPRQHDRVQCSWWCCKRRLFRCGWRYRSCVCEKGSGSIPFNPPHCKCCVNRTVVQMTSRAGAS